MARPRVLLGDDHVMFCEGLRSILEPHFEVVGIAENGQELVTTAERLQPDVVVADVSMPLLNGIGAARKLQKIKRPPKIVFLTMHADATYATEAFRAGASGYVLKSSPASEIVTAIQASSEAAVVVTVTANADAVPFTVTELGETEQVDSASVSEQLSATVPLNPLTGEA
jgi:DNA-binding NarL/FixJ family response regulator